MKIGVIYCCYGNPQYIDDCLKPWIEAKKTNDILIAAVHGQFKEYHDLGIEDKDLKTIEKLHVENLCNRLDYLYIQNWDHVIHNAIFPEQKIENIYQTEAEIRDKALQWLLKQNCDYIWLLDNDEFYTVEQIDRIIKYINYNPFITWFSIPFKNYIFDGKHWIDNFCPPRIFKTITNFIIDYKLNKCYWDNDFEYVDKSEKSVSYRNYASKSIPKSQAHIKHLTWLNSNGKQKVEYQQKHFGHCGYKWNEEKQQLEFDLDYHKKYNIPLPEVLKDEN